MYTATEVHDFVWANYPTACRLVGVAGSQWSMVYGDVRRIPKLLLHVESVGGTGPKIPRACAEAAQANLGALAKATNLPIGTLAFSPKGEVAVAGALAPDHGQTVVAWSGLGRLFEAFGFDIVDGGAVKPINVASASAYHDWQRDNLGRRLSVIDIDLFGVQGDAIVELQELKRSFYGHDRWKPFTDDQANYDLQANLARMAGVRATVAFHNKGDTSRFTVFDVEAGRRADTFTRRGTFPRDQWAMLAYLGGPISP